MSLFDAILGRDRPVRSKMEPLFRLTTAQITLQTQLALEATNHAGICFRPVSNAEWSEMEKEIAELLTISAKDSPLGWRWFSDSYGFKWVILEGQEFENVVATVHMLGDELSTHGFGEQLLAAFFQFREGGSRSAYMIYNYKRGAFYPFVPGPGSQERLNALEFRIGSVMGKELPIEHDREMWYPLWGVPL